MLVKVRNRFWRVVHGNFRSAPPYFTQKSVMEIYFVFDQINPEKTAL
jgi:hypothetical protein